uniref:Uncharacterized protein n=1 Tax=Brassica oleracea TaxID=3712 RepID=A0A3P6GKQ8_BRAOL|nr:unnamed protein product [Brassica oleracea]
MFYFQVINSVLVPTVDEETLLARIIDPKLEYQREGSTSDRWNYWLNMKQKKIWWKELYESDVATRKFTKTKDKEKVTIVEGSSSNSGLESMLKGVEERIVKAMEEGFSGINLTVETKLEAMNLRMGKLEKYQRVLKKKAKKIEDKLTSIESKGNEDEEYTQWNDFDYGRDHGKDRDMAEAEKAETGKKISEKGEEDEENSGKDEEDEEDEENSEKGEEYVEESDEENSMLRLHERVRVQAEEFWRTIDDESEAEKEAEEEVEKEGEEEAEKEGEEEVQEEKEGEEEGEKEVQEEKESEEEGEKEGEKKVQEEKEGEEEGEKEVQEEKEGEEEGEKEAEKEAKKEVQEEKEAEKEESKGTPTSTGTEIAELAEKSVESDVDQDVEEEEEKAEEIEDNPVENPAKKQTELAEKSVEVEVKTMRKPRFKVIAVPYGIPRAERLAKMRAETEKKKAKAGKKKAKADGAPKKKGRPKKTEATLKPCMPLPEKRKSEPSRWLQSPFTEGKTDELEVPKKKLKTKT